MLILLCAVLIPEEVEVDSDVNCWKFTASVGLAPAATFARTTGVVELTPPNVILARSTPSYWTEFAAIVDREATLLVVVLKPVDSEATLLMVALSPLDSEPSPVEVVVDSDATLLLVVDSPVDKELTAVLVANSCEPLSASVLLAVIRPAATLVT